MIHGTTIRSTEINSTCISMTSIIGQFQGEESDHAFRGQH